MKYDFNSIPDRSKDGATKWDDVNATVDCVPLSVADMEFPTAPAIADALADLSKNTILGYASPTEEYFDAVCAWMKRRHNFAIKKEWIMTTPGVISALAILIEGVTKPDDGILLLNPVYYPFDMVSVAKGRRIVYCPLINEDGNYRINYADLEEKAKDPKVKAILFCNPHNPVGRVWSEEELRRVGDICTDNGVFIISDEIHNDLIMPDFKHTLFATVGEKYAQNMAVCTAPSKTFNLAGLQCSNIFIPNDRIRARVLASSMLNMNMHLNIYAFAACKTAYNECEEWLDELLPVIQSNAKMVEDFMRENYPQVVVSPLQGTYLQWIDMRKLGLSHVEMRKALEDEKVYFDNGEMFGYAGRGFQRINLACSPVTIQKTLERFKKAVDGVYAKWEKEGKPYRQTLVVGEKLHNFVYDTVENSGLELQKTIKKPTLIAFLRFAECMVTKAVLDNLKRQYGKFKLLGCDVKAVLQSARQEVAVLQKNCPFELIADEDAVLYEMYDVFETNSFVQLIAGDKRYEDVAKGDVKSFLYCDMFDEFSSALLGLRTESKRRNLQLCAFVGVDKDMTIKLAHYSKTIGDFPTAREIVKGLK